MELCGNRTASGGLDKLWYGSQHLRIGRGSLVLWRSCYLCLGARRAVDRIPVSAFEPTGAPRLWLSASLVFSVVIAVWLTSGAVSNTGGVECAPASACSSIQTSQPFRLAVVVPFWVPVAITALPVGLMRTSSRRPAAVTAALLLCVWAVVGLFWGGPYYFPAAVALAIGARVDRHRQRPSGPTHW